MNEMGIVSMATEKTKEATNGVNVAEQRFMCQFDTIEQLYFEKEKMYLDRMAESEKRHAEEKDSMRKHYQRIIFSISLVLLLIVGSLVSAALYVYSNFDFKFQPSYSQSVSAEGGGDATNEDGIHINNYDHPLE